MQKYNWNYPTTVWAGEDRIKDLANACNKLSIKKPLLVTDSGLAQSDIVKNTLANLKEKSIQLNFIQM
jgi:alcohol dehydrogenase class IV